MKHDRELEPVQFSAENVKLERLRIRSELMELKARALETLAQSRGLHIQANEALARSWPYLLSPSDLLDRFVWPSSAAGAITLSDPRRHGIRGPRSRESGNVSQMRFYGGRNLAQAERDLVLTTLKRCSNNRTQTAKVLGMARSTLDKKLKQYAASGVPIPPAQNGGFRERAAPI